MSNAIEAITNKEAVTVINRLVKIALKAHGNDPSPVDIKLELAELPSDMLMQLDEDTTRLIKTI